MKYSISYSRSSKDEPVILNPSTSLYELHSLIEGLFEKTDIKHLDVSIDALPEQKEMSANKQAG